MRSDKQKGRGALRALRALILLLGLGCAGVGIYIYWWRPAAAAGPGGGPATGLAAGLAASSRGVEFAQGVSVAGVPLGGKNAQEAFAALAEVEHAMAAEVQFVMDAKNYSVTLTSADMPVSFNTAEVLAEAILLGNTGTKDEREAEREALLRDNRDFPITRTVDVSPARQDIAEIAKSVNTEPMDAAVEMDLSVDGWFRFREGVPGVTLDEDALLATLRQRSEEGAYGVVELPYQSTNPEITVENLQSTLTLRGKAETSFKKSPYNRADRVYNVKRAAGLVNGCVLKPDEVFSTNDALGPRTYELGWKPAPAYVSGTTEDQAGGGVCQVSTTLYAAVVKADLEIVYRRNHSSPVGYVDRGLDATINTGTIDFQFKNNTSSDIYVFAYTVDSGDGKVPEGMTDKTVHVEIFGAALPDEYDEIRLSSERLEVLKPKGEKQVVVDTTVASDYYSEEVKRQDGSVWQSYKHYYKDGVEVKKESLAKSTYKAWAGKVVVGTGYYASQAAAPAQ